MTSSDSPDLGSRARTLGASAARRGWSEQRSRVGRWRERLWLILQCSLSAGIAWFLCTRLLGHHQPFFGPVAAVVTLGMSFGQRLSRALEIAVGVAVGVFVGDVFVYFFGTGVWQIALVCFIAMSVAVWLGARNLMIIQSGLQSITVVTLLPQASQGFSRWLDAVVGVALALAVTTVAPASSVRRPRILAARMLQDAAATVRTVRRALDERDEELAQDAVVLARDTANRIARLREANAEGLAVVRYSLLHRSGLPAAQRIADLVGPLDRMCRDLRLLARRANVACWRGEPVPAAYLDLLDGLAEAMQFCAGELYERRLPVAAKPRLVGLGEASSRVDIVRQLSSAVVLAQVRSMTVDLLVLCGIPYDDARELVPDME